MFFIIYKFLFFIALPQYPEDFRLEGDWTFENWVLRPQAEELFPVSRNLILDPRGRVVVPVANNR